MVKKSKCEDWKCNVMTRDCFGGIYGLGFIGALFYYIVTATSFWGGAFGILKALVWPAILVFKLLMFLSA